MGTTWGSDSATDAARAEIPGRSDVASRGEEKCARSIESHAAHLRGSKSNDSAEANRNGPLKSQMNG